MKQLNKPTDNLGGLLSIWAVPPSDITISFNTVSFSTTDNIVKMYCSPGSISFTEKATLEKYRVAYKNEINAFIPKDAPETQSIINDMIGRKCVVILLDQNEYYKVAGTPEIPLRVSFDLDTGSDTRFLSTEHKLVKPSRRNLF
ncbi:MAG: hypothetical protein A2066_01625 [Bacteroidetes bacterium GWB2_41_8]|nr:MAG: hypothetical protein A2066_01625 [Bacteroidetes bacterium GWB2_41_8]